MKALAIVALVFSSIAIFVPVAGVFLALFCSLLAMISFRSQPTLAGISFGLNIINTAFLSPMIMVSDVMSSDAATAAAYSMEHTESGTIYWTYVGLHLTLFFFAIMWRAIRGAPKENIVTPQQ